MYLVNCHRNSKFEIGQWIQATDGIGQVVYVRRIFVEPYTTEYFEGNKVGEYSRDVLVYKILCDHGGKIRTRKRIAAENADYCQAIDKKAESTIREVFNDLDAYTNYLLYDEKKDMGWSLSVFFKVPDDSIPLLNESIRKISGILPSSFTFKEFLKIAKEQKLALDFSDAKKFVPGTGLNFSVNLFNRLYKVVNKQRIYTKVLASK